MGGLAPRADEGTSGLPEGARKSMAYCSANDRNVPVLVRRPRAPRRRRISYHDAERLLCLDYGVRCTGWACPLFDVPALPDDALTDTPHRRPQ